MQRYISESLYIESSTKEEGTLVMNSKSEWGRQKLTRMINNKVCILVHEDIQTPEFWWFHF